MSADIKISRSKPAQIVQSDRFLHKTLRRLGKSTLIELALPLAKDALLS